MMAERAGTKTRATLLAQVTPVQKEIQPAERSIATDARSASWREWQRGVGAAAMSVREELR